MRHRAALMLATPALIAGGAVAVSLMIGLPAGADTPPPAALAAAARFVELNTVPDLTAQFSAQGMAAAAGIAVPPDLDPALAAEIKATIAEMAAVVVPAVRKGTAEVLARRLPPDLLEALAAYADSPAGRAAVAARVARSTQPDLHDSRLAEPDPAMAEALRTAAAARGLNAPTDLRFPAGPDN